MLRTKPAMMMRRRLVFDKPWILNGNTTAFPHFQKSTMITNLISATLTAASRERLDAVEFSFVVFRLTRMPLAN